MALAASIVFFLSLIGIIGLFTLKRWELSRQRVLLPDFRMRADSEARKLKELLSAAKNDLGNLPPLLLFAGQSIVHGIAVDAGHVAHWLGTQSHRLADSVSHKRNFERGETRSEFLRKVSEHPIRNRSGSNGAGKNDGGLDTTEDDGHNT